MTTVAPMIFVVDDDPSVRTSLGRLLEAAGYAVETFASAREFLARAPRGGPCCLVLEVRMPGLTGLELQEALAEETRVAEIRQRVRMLSPRETEVFALVVAGVLNKQIAAKLGVEEKLVKVHGARVMAKMRAGSVAELVRLADRVSVIVPES